MQKKMWGIYWESSDLTTIVFLLRLHTRILAKSNILCIMLLSDNQNMLHPHDNSKISQIIVTLVAYTCGFLFIYPLNYKCIWSTFHILTHVNAFPILIVFYWMKYKTAVEILFEIVESHMWRSFYLINSKNLLALIAGTMNTTFFVFKGNLG